MPRTLLPKYLLTTLSLALGIVCLVTLALYVNFNRLADELVEAGVEPKDAILKTRLEERAAASMRSLERELDGPLAANDRATLAELLDEVGDGARSLVGLSVLDPNGASIARWGLDADPPAGAVLDGDRWSENALYLSYRIRLGGDDLGELHGRFSLAERDQDLAAFERDLEAIEDRYRRRAAIWIAAITFGMLVGCALLAWVTARRLVRPITALTHQAERLKQGDYGDKLPVERRDELGELADAFNDMRDQLRQTTISRDYIDSVLSSMNDAVIVTAPDGTVTRANTATARMLGYTEEELLGRPVTTIVADDYREGFAKLGLDGIPHESVFSTADGRHIPVSYTCSVITTDNPLFEGQIYAFQNITERKRAEQRIRYLARIDALTKVPNRMQFQHLLQRAIARARRDRHCLALMYLDIDQFKDINDTFGHLAGDATLETLSERLTRELPEKSVVGRLAGDEFAVIVDALTDETTAREDVARIAERLLAKIALPFAVQGNEVFMTASLGIAFYPVDAGNVIDLIRNADAALYHAKKAGGDAFEFYDPRMNEAAVERLMLKSKLRRAFERDELLLRYQPKYDLRDGAVIGAEALVRWELPERGVVMPSEFIPLAEESNLILEIGEWVLERVCEDFRLWQRSMPTPGRVSINLSLKQLKQRNFIDRVGAIVRAHRVSPTSLEFEITETTLMEDTTRTIRMLDELYALGVHLAIDDFGTGYSSLSALQQFPINTLKIDKSFVRDAAVDADDATIVATIIDMGKSLKMDVVAEGVETGEQLSFLQTLDCNYVQGLLFGEPMNADEYLSLLLAQEDGTDVHRALFA